MVIAGPVGDVLLTQMRNNARVILDDPHQVLVLLKHPAGGTWRVQTTAG